MRKEIKHQTFYKLYATICTIILIIVLTLTFFISKNNLFLNILFVFLSLSIFFIMGIGIWNIMLLQKHKKGIIVNLLNCFILGLIVVLVWSISNHLLLISIKKIFGVMVMRDLKLFPHIFLGSLLYIIDILFFHLLLLFSKYNEKSISEEKLKAKLIETRLNTLKAYINPHFLFNSLNSVNALIKSNADRAREMLVNISDYFRYSIKQKDNNFVTLIEEYNNALLYLEIEKLRFIDRIKIEENISKEAELLLIPTMLLQPLLENIVKHAVAPSNDIINIKFSATTIYNDIEIYISNNYNSKYQSKSSNGLGLSTIVERLNLIYEREDIIKITKTNTQFIITITIPIIKENEINNN